MKRRICFYIVFLIAIVRSSAQCAMCRAVLESEEGQSAAEGVNDGIMYLMVVPYILVAGIGFFIYWNYFRRNKTVTQ